MKTITSTLAVCLLSLSSAIQAQHHHQPQGDHTPDCSQCDFEIGQPVLTTSGLVHGHPASNATQVSEYLGIPFAKPPINDLRFAPPEAYHSRANISGAAFGNFCPQLILGTEIPKTLPSTVYNILCEITGCGQTPKEDCLTLNVWSKPQSGSAKKPVMVWIYGGAFDTGGTNLTLYNGQYFVDQEDVVFVTFNYRLGIFGFPGGPTLEQNVALLDQRLALEWVRDNIAQFGGDVDRITLFGESAGAACVEYYNYVWTHDPIIAGSIAQSGSAFGFGNNAAAAQATKWYDLSKKLGCGDNTTASADAVVACMRDPAKVSMQALLNGTASQLQAVFGPTIDHKTVFANYTQRSVDGHFVQKPFLAGSNINEAGLFELILLGSGDPASQQPFYDSLTLDIFTCPSNTQAWARWLHNVPVWRYRYFPSFPNIDIPTSVGQAYHSAEIPVLFGTDQEVSGADSTARERTVGSYIRGAWAAFAHCPATGLARALQWPEYSPLTNGTAGLVLLGRENMSAVAEFSARGPWDGTCPLVVDGP